MGFFRKIHATWVIEVNLYVCCTTLVEFVKKLLYCICIVLVYNKLVGLFLHRTFAGYLPRTWYHTWWTLSDPPNVTTSTFGPFDVSPRVVVPSESNIEGDVVDISGAPNCISVVNTDGVTGARLLAARP